MPETTQTPNQLEVTNQGVARPYEKLRSGYINYARFAGILLLPALLYIFFLNRGYKDALVSSDAMKKQLDSVTTRVTYLTNEKGIVVTENIGLKAQNEKALKDMSASVFALKKNQEKLIKQVVFLSKVSQAVRIDTVFVPFDTSFRRSYAGRTDSIAVPQRFNLSDSLKQIAGTVTKAGVTLDSLGITNELYIRFGTKKTGFLNLGSKKFVQAINTSPYVQNNGLGITYYEPPVSRWNKWIKPALVGILAAAGGIWIMK